MSYSGRNRRGRIKIPEHTHPLVRQFFEAVNEQMTTLEEIGNRTHVGVDTMRFWKTRHMPRVDLLDAALNALDLELFIRPRVRPGRPPSAPMRTIDTSDRPFGLGDTA